MHHAHFHISVPIFAKAHRSRVKAVANYAIIPHLYICILIKYGEVNSSHISAFSLIIHNQETFVHIEILEPSSNTAYIHKVNFFL